MIKAVKKYLKDTFALRAGKVSDYLWAIFGTILMAMIPMWFRSPLVDESVKEVPDGLQPWYEVIMGPQTYDFYLILLSVCIITPILEELFFRGIFWKLLKKFSDETYAFFLTSILFAFAHVDPEHIVGVFPIGIYIGWLRLRSDSIFPSILAHVINNSIVCFLLLNL